MLRDDLADLVQQMIDRGILFDDAQREFERVFLARALAKTILPVLGVPVPSRYLLGEE
jgi:hypothetical protein